MGTTGVEVIRDRGYYFVWTVPCDGYPEDGLGAKVYWMIPEYAHDLKSWREELREDLVEFHHKYDTHADDDVLYGEAKDLNGIPVIAAFVTNDWTHYEKNTYAYEIDLDNMLFIYRGYPVYHLDHMPPEEVFFRSCEVLDGEDTPGGIDEFYEDTPAEYRFSLSRLSQLAPEVKDREISTYKKSSIEVILDPSSILLSSPSDLTRAEDVSLRFLASILHFYRDEQRLVIYHEIALINSRRVTGERGWALCSLFAAMALFPLHIVGLHPGWRSKEGPWYDFFSRSHEEFWFIRQHICVTFGSHLLDERNAKYHISKLIDRIVSDRDSPQVTYGVVFSLFHCIVVRIDKLAARCHFSRTEVLEFLPPLFGASSGITPGMELLTRLGHLKGEDDLDVFYSCLSTQWWNYKSGWYTTGPCTKASPTSPTRYASHAPRLPLEIMMMIASELVWPRHLFDFALASKFHMTAAMPRLRLPQVWGVDPCYYSWYDEDPWVSYILDSCATDSLPATFRIRHECEPALLQLRYSMHIAMDIASTRTDEPQRSGIMQWDYRTPHAFLTFGKSRGYYSNSCWEDCDTYCAYSNPHAEVGFVVGWEVESENEDSVNGDE